MLAASSERERRHLSLGLLELLRSGSQREVGSGGREGDAALEDPADYPTELLVPGRQFIRPGYQFFDEVAHGYRAAGAGTTSRG